MKNARLILAISVIIFSILVIFRAFFASGPLSLGDAPFFTEELTATYLRQPSLWTYLGTGFGRVNDIIWISPILVVVGLLHSLFFLSHDILIRMVFYFPAVILAAIGPALIARYLRLEKIVWFFASFVYVLNTFFILLVDGGQVGVALSYGIFPFCFLAILQMLEQQKTKYFFLGVLIFFIQTIADIRIALVALITAIVFYLLQSLLQKRDVKKAICLIILLLFSNLLLNLFWIIPFFFSASGSSMATEVASLQLMSLLNSLTLFQPHWPDNIYGKVTAPPFYFVGIVFLVIAGLLQKKSSKSFLALLACFLVFAFLAKGTTYPAGTIYQFIVEKVPFGFAFRDSSKFMFPTILFAGILMGESIKRFQKNLIIPSVAAVYILFLLSTAILGKLNFVLSGKSADIKTQQYSQIMRDDSGFFRAAWFPEKHPQVLTTDQKISFDAKELVDFRPFARLNGGNSDRFNFMNNPDYLDWYRIFGIKYLFLRGNPRALSLSDEEKKDWNALSSLIENDKRIIKKSDGAYEVPSPVPHIFGAKRAIAVVGSDDVYEKIKLRNADFFPGNMPFAFFEDGIVNIDILDKVDPSALSLYFNDKNILDLVLSTFADQFLNANKKSQWAVYSASNYLKYKFELLIRDIDYKEFDFGRGIAFSSVSGEKLIFDTQIPENGKYLLAVRSMSNDPNSSLGVNIASQTHKITHKKPSVFEWSVFPVDLAKGKIEVSLTNDGFNVVNTAVVIPAAQYQQATDKVDNLLKKHKAVTFEELLRLTQRNSWIAIEDKSSHPSSHQLTIPQHTPWIIFIDKFTNDWKLNGQTPYPAYSAVNAFYINNAINGDLVFVNQQLVSKGLLASSAAALVLILVFFYAKFRHKIS